MSKRYVDLHAHSKASDGSFSPTELVKLAKRKGLSAIAITDHDAVSGIAEALAAGRKYGLEVVPGVEITCYLGGEELHIVGLYIDPANKRLRKTLKMLSDSRIGYIKKVLKNLNSALRRDGIAKKVSFNEVMGLCRETTSIGRPIVAKAMVKKGISRDERDAFDAYLARKEIMAPKSSYPAKRAIAAIKGAGGLAILAHPLLQYKTEKGVRMERIRRSKKLDRAIRCLKKNGLDGIECRFAAGEREMSAGMAKRLGLAVSGGSDWHGKESACMLGSLNIPYSVLDNLKKRMKK